MRGWGREVQKERGPRQKSLPSSPERFKGKSELGGGPVNRTGRVKENKLDAVVPQLKAAPSPGGWPVPSRHKEGLV